MVDVNFILVITNASQSRNASFCLIHCNDLKNLLYDNDVIGIRDPYIQNPTINLMLYNFCLVPLRLEFIVIEGLPI